MNAPDLIDPVIGFRAWRPDPDGSLVPWSAGRAGTWQPGVNTATCLRPRANHGAPAHDCSCGLYALADHRDDRLDSCWQAVGAIVAWGDMELHRTGFRAQYACIVALVLPAVCGEENRRRLAAAAARYEVPLVPDDRLLEIALEHGQRLSFDEVSPRQRVPRPAAGTVPMLSLGGPLGTAVDDHVHVELDEQRAWIRLTSPLAAELPAGAAVHQQVDGGDSVRRGDTLATVNAGDDTIVVRSPLSALIALPHGSSTKNWRLGLIPTRWDDEAPRLTWGEPGLRLYAAQIADERRDGDPFASVRARWLRANAHVNSAADVLRELRAARARPRFADAEEVRRRVAGRLQLALHDPTVARHLSRLRMCIAWRLHNPEIDIVVDLAASPAVVHTDARTDDAQLVVYTSAELADEWLAGRLDLPAAVRRRDVQTGASLSELLGVASVLSAMHETYARQVACSRPGGADERPQ